ncbi:MAG: Stk1 family PASTA domain-containing Ser/Thr kinase [Acidimicrobiales bacterium]|nr:Stk1 family PASTA domain-containing Ser/Thr kinase [Acidimicrobiales bacterium]
MTDSTAQRPVLNGRYELHRRLARGGMADVFLAHDQLLDRPVAVKVLFPQFASEPLFVERFRREAQAAANLNHHSIVAVYDWGEYDRTYFIVMEYVEGRSLAEVLRSEGVLHPDRAIEIAIDTAAALGFAHRNGTIHRDVKPGNILITPGGQVKVTDFGIARAFGGGDDLTQTGSVMGTATYFSPEQAQGKQVDPRSDLYSLGVVLFEMITGQPPFNGDTPVAIAYKHVQDEAPTPAAVNPKVPTQLGSIVDKLLAKQPHERFASAEDLRAELRRAGDDAVVNPRPSVLQTPAEAGSVATTSVPSVTSLAVDQSAPVAPAVMAHAMSGAPEYVEPPRRNGLFLLALLIMILGVAGIAGYIYVNFGDQDVAGPNLVEVPSVTNRSQGEAEKTLTDLGFEFEARAVDAPEGVPPGSVVDQSPASGELLEEGSVVVIQVARSTLKVPLDDVSGFNLDEATRRLEEDGFVVDFSVEPSLDIPENIVIRLEPEPGQELERGSRVNLIVSSGPDQVDVPDVKNMSVLEASNELGRAGLPNPTLVYEASEDVEEGMVIRTDPDAGVPVSIDRVILLVVSTGPPEAIVPPVVGLDQGSAQSALEQAGFAPFVEFVDVPNGSPDAGVVLSQDPAGNTALVTGSTVRIRVGLELAPPPPDTQPPGEDG